MAYLKDRLYGDGAPELDVLTFCPPPKANLSEIAELCDADNPSGNNITRNNKYSTSFHSIKA